MGKGIFMIYDPDLEFAFRFMEFAKQRVTGLDVRAFTSEESLCRAVEQAYPEILLVSSAVLTDSVQVLKAGKLLVLEEDTGSPEGDLPACLYKYQPPEDLLKKVLDFCGEGEKEPVIAEKRDAGLEIIGIYSPVGRTRKTSFAITMGQILARNRGVLYLNMESYAGFEQLFGQEYDRNLSDLLYFSRQKDADLQKKLTGIVKSIQNLDYVPPVLCPEDIQEVPAEDWRTLFKRLEEETGYEILLLDLGDAVQGLFSQLEICSRIYLPVRSDPMSVAKLDQFFRCLEHRKSRDLEKKIKKVKLPFCQNGKVGKDFFQDLVWSEMGDLVRKELAEGTRECSQNS